MPESHNSLYAAGDLAWIERQNWMMCGWYLLPNFGDASIFCCCSQKTLICGVISSPLSASIARISFSKFSSIGKLFFSKYFSNCEIRPSSSLQTTLCLCTIATNHSLLDLGRGALSFRG